MVAILVPAAPVGRALKVIVLEVLPGEMATWPPLELKV
jgi:hypothetical protein